MTRSNKVSIGVIGLGSMGLGMAQAALKKGLKVVGYDRNSGSVSKLVEAGGCAAESPAAAAAGADVIVIVVVNAHQTEAVLFGDDGVAAAMRRDATVISSATMAPADARRLAEMTEARGLHYLDAPMSGGAAKAATGELTFMASGSAEAFRRARPVLETMARTVHHLGDTAGIGASYKIVNQLLAGVHIAAACEAITFAGRLGLDLALVYKVITASAGNSWMFENRVPHILDGDYSPKSTVEIFIKDLGIVNDIGRIENFPLSMGSTALQMFLMTAASGMGRDDDASVAKMIASVTGLALPASTEIV